MSTSPFILTLSFFLKNTNLFIFIWYEVITGENSMKIKGKVVETEPPQFKHRWFGILEVECNKQRYRLYMSGTIAQWFIEGEKVEISILKKGKKDKKTNTVILDFDDYELYRLWKGERIKVWPVLARARTLIRQLNSFRKNFQHYW